LLDHFGFFPPVAQYGSYLGSTGGVGFRFIHGLATKSQREPIPKQNSQRKARQKQIAIKDINTVTKNSITNSSYFGFLTFFFLGFFP